MRIGTLGEGSKQAVRFKRLRDTMVAPGFFATQTNPFSSLGIASTY
jgi:hypothetical protein